jgi:hypothetical protein
MKLPSIKDRESQDFYINTNVAYLCRQFSSDPIEIFFDFPNNASFTIPFRKIDNLISLRNCGAHTFRWQFKRFVSQKLRHGINLN